MDYNLLVERVHIPSSNPCYFYPTVWVWFEKDKITKETWDKYTMACLKSLMENNADVLDRLKEAE